MIGPMKVSKATRTIFSAPAKNTMARPPTLAPTASAASPPVSRVSPVTTASAAREAAAAAAARARNSSAVATPGSSVRNRSILAESVLATDTKPPKALPTPSTAGLMFSSVLV